MADSNRAFPADAGRATHERSRVAPSPPVPNAAQLEALARRCEQYLGAEHDKGWHDRIAREIADYAESIGLLSVGMLIPQYTRSVDAALTLVPEGLPIHHIGQLGQNRWSCGLVGVDRELNGYGRTAALAITAAALRARAAQAIEAQRAETQGGSVEDESAVGNADVPKGNPVGSQIG